MHFLLMSEVTAFPRQRKRFYSFLVLSGQRVFKASHLFGDSFFGHTGFILAEPSFKSLYGQCAHRGTSGPHPTLIIVVGQQISIKISVTHRF